MDIESLFNQTLAGNYDDEAPWNAVHKLRTLGTRAVFEKAVGWCSSDDALQRARGADILAQFGRTSENPTNDFADETFMVLLGMALNEQEIQPLSSAIQALGHLGDKRAVPIITNYSMSTDSSVRFAVACACGSFPDERLSVETLLELMEDEDADTREWATFGIGTLSNLDSAEIRKRLANGLQDPSEDVRQEALAGLARRQDERALPYLTVQLKQPQVDESVLEAASLMLDEDPPETWQPRDYLAALRERYDHKTASKNGK